MISIKGQAVRQYLSTLKAMYGEEKYAELVDKFENDEFRELAQSENILASAWYPISYANQLIAATVATIPDIPDIPEQLGKEAMARDLRGIYGYIAGFLNPDVCLRYTPRLIQTFNKGLKLEAEKLGPGHARVHFTNSSEISDLLFRTMTGGTAAIFERVGARNLTIKIVEGGKLGDPATTFELRWDA